jgi:hypothetical protein
MPQPQPERAQRALYVGLRATVAGLGVQRRQRRPHRVASPRLPASRARAKPSGVRGPVESPPCIRQRPFRTLPRVGSHTARAWQAWPSRHRAPQWRQSVLIFVGIRI